MVKREADGLCWAGDHNAWRSAPSVRGIPPQRGQVALLSPLRQLVAEHEWMVHAVADRGTALAPQPLQLTCAGPCHDRIVLLRLPTFEDAAPPEHECARPVPESPDDPLKAD